VPYRHGPLRSCKVRVEARPPVPSPRACPPGGRGLALLRPAFPAQEKTRAPQPPSFVSLDASLGYGFLPIRNAESIGIDLEGRFGLGYGFGFMNQLAPFRSGGSPCLEGGLQANALLSRAFALEAGVGYRNHLGPMQSLAILLGMDLRLSRRTKPAVLQTLPARPELHEDTSKAGLEVDSVEYQSIFPVFHEYYDDNPVGRAVLRNTAIYTSSPTYVFTSRADPTWQAMG
jgi:hypothetical protein